MNRELEIRIGLRIDAALDRIRSKASLMGMAGEWHVSRASDILQNPDLLERYVKPLSEHEEAEYLDQLPDDILQSQDLFERHMQLLSEQAEAKYLDQLPALIAETKEQDQCCAQCWDSDMGPEQESRYLAEREKLIQLLQRFQFQPKLYERLVRQPDKPILRNAIWFLSAGQENT